MTRFDPSLFLSRLVVTRHGKIAYDQRFHLGVNIIRGDNSHGKSTIAEFIFFVLGGDVYKWKIEAAACDDVWAEILASGATITLRRSITDKKGQGMSIFFGAYEEAKKSAVEGWRVFSYRAAGDKESFSVALFRALGMPETLGETASHITLHQLLRLIYVDQITSPDGLMRSEEFDSPLTRKIIVDYLLGVYDNTLYQEQLDHREGKRKQDEMREQQRQLENVLDRAEIDTDPKALADKVDRANERLMAIDNELVDLQAVANAARVIVKNELLPVSEKLNEQRRASYVLSNQTQDLTLEVEDSRLFVNALANRLTSLDDAAAARDFLGEMPLHFCPQCLSPLTSKHEEGSCALCKQPANPEITRTHAARMRQELALQISESKSVLEKKESELRIKGATLERLNKEIAGLQKEYERLAATVQTARNTKIDSLLVEKGRMERTIADLSQKNKIIQVLLGIKAQEAELSARLQQLAISIQRRQSNQKARYFEVMAVIQEITVDLLRHDLHLEERFDLAREITVTPETNTFAVDGKNQFSASSMTYLKNSIHFAFFFASLKLPYVRYPRLIVCDNMEDKGMTRERSRNFQRNIVELSKNATIEHQIIFTTSMMDLTLEKAEYTIGPNYVDGVKSLDVAAPRTLGKA